MERRLHRDGVRRPAVDLLPLDTRLKIRQKNLELFLLRVFHGAKKLKARRSAFDPKRTWASTFAAMA
jgi:hypothetical protein